eukprot:7057028-Alexandrium_andersonii.AAC.1
MAPSPRTPRKRIQRAHGPVSSADLASARERVQNAPLQSFGDEFRGRCWGCAIQASNCLEHSSAS